MATKSNNMKFLQCIAIISCCLVLCCRGLILTIPLDGKRNIAFIRYENSMVLKCEQTSGTIDQSLPRRWLKDGVVLINNGALSTAGSGYSETLNANSFSLTSPPLNHTFNGTEYQCVYDFVKAYADVIIVEIGSTDKSDGKCIKGKDIKDCWFSMSKATPMISEISLSLIANFEDGTQENITSMLNTNSQLNADGITLKYDFRVTTSLSNDVKSIVLSFTVGDSPQTLTIEASCSPFLNGFLAVFLIDVTGEIIMFLILFKDLFPKFFGGLTKMKIGIMIIVLLFALAVGLGLGLGITACSQMSVSLGVSIGLGLFLVMLLFLLIFICHRCSESHDTQRNTVENGNGKSKESKKPEDVAKQQGKSKDSKKSENVTELQGKSELKKPGDVAKQQGKSGEGTKSEDVAEREASPTSTTKVELDEKNKTVVPKNNESTLNQKPMHSPLPDLPSANNSQPPASSAHNFPDAPRKTLEPISMGNEGGSSPEKRKKKKKKKDKDNNKETPEDEKNKKAANDVTMNMNF